MKPKILIANRGEIALRILRAAKELGFGTVVVHSACDRDSLAVRLADEHICIGPSKSSESYLKTSAILTAAEIAGVEAIHPGYGFLSEQASFARQVKDSGFIFIGPNSDHISLMGDKISAINYVRNFGLTCVPGSQEPLPTSNKECLKIAAQVAYPVMIKAAGGGGGRGMRVVESEEDLLDAIAVTRSEAKNAFGNDTLYIEKFLKNPRHIEIQVIADKYGHAVHLGARDCSLQRRHQKILEESLPMHLPLEEVNLIGEKCARLCAHLGYLGVGTFEFLYECGEFYFIEMNTRIQVEHPVTEMITGIDLVQEQIRLAFGGALTLKQEDILFKGHSIECRINAEDPYTYVPCPGTISFLHVPGGPGVRWDSHLYVGYKIPAHYDSLIGKLIVHAPTREQAFAKMKQALDELVIEGVKTNIALHQELLKEARFQKGHHTIHYLQERQEQTV